MKKRHCLIIIILVFVLSGIAYPGLRAKDLQIAFPATLPPWTLEEQDAGITVEVVREALQLQGYGLKTKYIPLSRLNREIEAGLDGHAQVESPTLKGYYSKQVMVFQTSVITLDKNQFQFHSIQELSDKTLVAFQNASILFGDAFTQMAQKNPRYKEMFKQENQVALLYKGRADAILLDKNIFLYYQRITSLVDTSPSVVFHHIKGLTEPSPAFIVFRDQTLRDTFNIGLKTLSEKGRYKAIFRKYVR